MRKMTRKQLTIEGNDMPNCKNCHIADACRADDDRYYQPPCATKYRDCEVCDNGKLRLNAFPPDKYNNCPWCGRELP